jgi:hypothetical protein
MSQDRVGCAGARSSSVSQPGGQPQPAAAQPLAVPLPGKSAHSCRARVTERPAPRAMDCHGAPASAISLIRAFRVSRSVGSPAAFIAWRTASCETPSWRALPRSDAGSPGALRAAGSMTGRRCFDAGRRSGSSIRTAPSGLTCATHPRRFRECELDRAACRRHHSDSSARSGACCLRDGGDERLQVAEHRLDAR